MKEYKVFYLAEVEKPDNPDATYKKFYPKADGFYTLDSAGNELKIEGIKVVDENDNVLPQKSFLKFGWPFTVSEDGDNISITLFDEDSDSSFLFDHGNEHHTTPFATEVDLQEHLDDEAPHGIVLGNIHEQNTDEYLDFGGDNQVSAGELKTLLSTESFTISTFTAAEQNVGSTGVHLADTTSNHVKFVLPLAASNTNKEFTFRHVKGTNAMNVERSEMDIIMFNDLEWEGITTDVKGTWFTLKSDGTAWHVVRDSGLTVANAI